MRHQIVHAIKAHNKEIDAYIEKSVDAALKDYRFEESFFRKINETIDQEVNRKLCCIISDAIDAAFKDPKFGEELTSVIKARIRI